MTGERVWSRPVVWVRGETSLGEPTCGIVSPSNITVDDDDFDAAPSLERRTKEYEKRTNQFTPCWPSARRPLGTPAGLKPMIDLMQRARDRETYGGAVDD